MESNADVQKRLTTLEREVAALKSKLDGGSEGKKAKQQLVRQGCGQHERHSG